MSQLQIGLRGHSRINKPFTPGGGSRKGSPHFIGDHAPFSCRKYLIADVCNIVRRLEVVHAESLRTSGISRKAAAASIIP
ncbi:MAG: hypothetical protein V3S11_06650, partial [Elusimicrobiota bacterium]